MEKVLALVRKLLWMWFVGFTVQWRVGRGFSVEAASWWVPPLFFCWDYFHIVYGKKTLKWRIVTIREAFPWKKTEFHEKIVNWVGGFARFHKILFVQHKFKSFDINILRMRNNESWLYVAFLLKCQQILVQVCSSIGVALTRSTSLARFAPCAQKPFLLEGRKIANPET